MCVLYHTVDFVCEFLILFVQILQNGAGSQIFIPQSYLHIGFNSVIATHVTVPCLVNWLTYVSLQVLKESGH